MVAGAAAARPGSPVVVVVGVGLIGASVGCALTARGHRVHLEDRTLSHARVAAELGAGTIERPDPGQVGLVVVAVPPRALPDVIVSALQRYPHASVTDVGSVKASVLDRLWRSGADRSRYVGSHPMAGSQRSGPMTARADLFEGRTWVVTPHRQSAADSVAAVSGLVAACGAHEVRMDVVDHDAAVARVSHLPHLMSVLMAEHLTAVPAEHLLLAGQGLRDVTRIAGSDPHLWEEIVAENSAALLPELRLVQARLDAVIEAVDRADGAVAEHLRTGVAGTRRIPGKHGTAPVDYGHVVVEIPDAPGALGRLFSDVGDAGVNVEDIAIEHDQSRQVGYLSLAVQRERAAPLASAMAARGWTAAVPRDADEP